MSVKMIQDRLNGYNCRSSLEEEQALREITQEILLAALGTNGFFPEGRISGRHLSPNFPRIESFF